MCKRDTESAKVAPESLLINRRESQSTHLTGEGSLRVRLLPGGGYLRGVVSGGISVHQWLWLALIGDLIGNYAGFTTIKSQHSNS